MAGFEKVDGEWWYVWGQDRIRRTRAKMVTCAQCGKEFPARGNLDAKFCTRQCAGLAHVGAIGSGPESLRWKGGRRISLGYVLIWKPDHPTCQGNQRKYVAEHRLVMEAKLGRYLTSKEYVHHINGDKEDNRPENLEIIGGSEHAKRHRANHFKAVGKPPHCPTCTCGK